jgi:hypothetical protein
MLVRVVKVKDPIDTVYVDAVYKHIEESGTLFLRQANVRNTFQGGVIRFDEGQIAVLRDTGTITSSGWTFVLVEEGREPIEF